VIRFRCHNAGCRRWIQAPESAAGTPALCPACRDVQRVPSWFGQDTASPRRGSSPAGIPREDSRSGPPTVSLSRRKRGVGILKLLALATGFLLLVGLLVGGGLWMEREIYPRDSIRSYNQGVRLQQAGRLEEAEEAFRHAIWKDPTNASAHNHLGEVLSSLRRDEEASVCFRNAIRHDPSFAVPHLNLGKLLARQWRYDEAIAEYREAIRLDPGLHDAFSQLGAALEQTGREGEARKAFHKAQEIRQEQADHP
jgi:cytochrome c-type biogenesis protein CcmH/NrfG